MAILKNLKTQLNPKQNEFVKDRFFIWSRIDQKFLDNKLYSRNIQTCQKSRNISNFSNLKPIYQFIFLISKFTLKIQYV